MSLTLTEGNLYSRTELQRAVIDRLVKDSRVLELLPFETVLGNSLTYNTITTDSGAEFYSVGDTWTESTPSLTQATAALVVLGGDADVDNFLLKTRSNITDMKGVVISNKTKAVQYKYVDTFYYGDDSSNAKEFDGLHVLMTSTTYNTVHAGSGTGTALSIAKFRQAIDLAPDSWERNRKIHITKSLRRGISVYLDSIGSAFPTGRDEWGRPVAMFDGYEIIPDEHIVATETAASGAYSAKTGGGNSTIFILAYDPMGVCGIHSGEGVQIEPLGSLETKDASRWRIKWYTGLKLEDIRSSAKVDGIDDDGTVVA